MPFAYGHALDQVTLKRACHGGRAYAAVAYEANAPTREPLNSRDADLLGEASGYDLAFVQVDEKGATHFLARRAAAMASCAFEYR